MSVVKVDREDLDEAAFSAVQDVMEGVQGWTTRQKLTVTLNVTNALMARFDSITKDAGKSENASKAAKKRWSKNKPTPKNTVPMAPVDATTPAPFGSQGNSEPERI